MTGLIWSDQTHASNALQDMYTQESIQHDGTFSPHLYAAFESKMSA